VAKDAAPSNRPRVRLVAGPKNAELLRELAADLARRGIPVELHVVTPRPPSKPGPGARPCRMPGAGVDE
jgi:hypothetical protein